MFVHFPLLIFSAVKAASLIKRVHCNRFQEFYVNCDVECLDSYNYSLVPSIIRPQKQPGDHCQSDGRV